MRRSHFSLLIVPTLIAAAHALAAGPTHGLAHHASHGMNTCESARLAAWFEGQRQLTDGNVNPMQVLPTPAECARLDARAEDGRKPMDDHQATSKGSARDERG